MATPNPTGVRGVWERLFVREYGYTVTEHDPARLWIVLGSEHRTITLADDASFFAWAAEQWPPPRWAVEIDPWELCPQVATHPPEG